MFYSHFILARKGPLGTIWIAAHLEGKLRKNQVTETNISASVDSILFPDVPIALRLSGHLLLGVVRIYSRKVNYLYHDCSEALVKIKQAFHCSSVNLPPEASKVPFHSITLPETFDFEELEASFKWDKAHILSGESTDDHVSERDLITLQDQTQEQPHGSFFDPDERFPGSSDPYSVLFESNKEHAEEPLHSSNQVLLHQEIGVSALEEEVLPPFPVDEKMELDREDAMHTDQGVPLSIGEKGKSSVFHSQSMQDIPDIERLRAAPEQKGPEPLFMELEEEQLPSSNTLKPSQDNDTLDESGFHDAEVTPVLHETPLSRGPSPVIGGEYDKYTGNEDLLGEILGGRTPAFKVASPFEDVPESAQQKKKRKRKPVFDDNPILSSKSMKKQLAGAGDLLRQRSKIPRIDCEARGFGMPSLPGLSGPLTELYSRFTALPSEEQRCSSWINENYTQFYEDRVRDPEAELPVGAKDPLHKSVPPLYSPHSSPLHAQHIMANNAEENGMDTRESQIFQHVSVAAAGQQDPFIEVAQIGRHMLDGGDTLPNVNCPSEACGQDDEKIDHSEAFATQASGNGANDITPLSSPTLTCTPRSLNVSSHGNNVVPKLDFLEASRDNGAEDPFIDETETNSHRKEKLSHNSYGWSVRTKSVAKYLKSIFEELEATSGASQPAQASLDSLLKGRPRKEAARLYFEILVLKSRDYIDVEQKTGFAEIMLSSTPLLRKDIL